MAVPDITAPASVVSILKVGPVLPNPKLVPSKYKFDSPLNGVVPLPVAVTT